MEFLKQNITLIARYEAKMLFRDWSFKFIVSITVAMVFLLHLAVQSNFNTPTWGAISLASSIPYANAYLINYIQIFITFFFAGRYLLYPQKLDTIDAIRVRPYSNTEYVLGKTLGFLFVIFILNVLLVSSGMFVHLCLSSSPWALYPYVFYFFTLTLPLLLFVMGVTIWAKSVFRHQAFALFILFSFFFLVVAYGARFLHGSLDIFSFTLPNMFSEWTGFSGLELYLVQRVTFVFWGVGLLFLSVRLAIRQTNQRDGYLLQIMGFTLLVFGVLTTWMFYSTYQREERARKVARQIFIKYEKTPKIQIIDHHVSFKQNDRSFSGTSNITLLNPHEEPLPLFILYLNPGLKIKEITSECIPVSFRREGQIIILDHPLQPQEKRNIQIGYVGHITPEVCYPEIDDLDDLRPFRSYSFFYYGRETFFLQKDFTLLTPECQWYPASHPTVNVLTPYTSSRTFTSFSLDVIGEKGRVVISQGTCVTTKDTIRFTNIQPLTGLTLCMGDYMRKSATVENITTELYLFKGHENLIKGVKNMQDILAGRLRGGYRTPRYPFRKLALVEIPVHFCTYTRPWRNESEQLQPEIIFRPEVEAFGLINPRLDAISFVNEMQDTTAEWVSLYERTYLSYNYGIPSQNIFLNIVNKHLKVLLLPNGTNYHSLFKNFHFNLSSDEFPGINSVINILPERWRAARRNMIRDVKFPIIEYLRDHSLATALQDLEAQPIIYQLVMYKTDQLIKHISIDRYDESFMSFLHQFIDYRSFQPVTFEQFCKEYQQEGGIDLLPVFRRWYEQAELPIYSVKDMRFYTVVNSKGEDITIRSFKIWNKGQVDGIVSVSTEDNDTRNRLGSEDFLIPARTCKEIRTKFAGRVSSLNVELSTGLSQNLPGANSYRALPVLEITSEPELGIFDIDSTDFGPLPGEYIVDNESQGFRLIDNGTKLQKFMTKEPIPSIKTFEFVPDRWTKYIHAGAYGEPIRSYYCKKAGSGSVSIEWETRLAEKGEYELFTFVNYDFYEEFTKVVLVKKGEQFPDGPVIPSRVSQTYQFVHKNGKENITLETNISGNGWVSLGKYYFPAGFAKIMLTDQGAYPEQCIYADAVKWVKRGN